jgi:tetratricopeptide (TPR) repeat protein
LPVQIRATLGQAYATACEYGPALELLDEAIEIKRKHRSGARRSIGLAYSISCKAFVLSDQGQFDRAYKGFDEAVDTLGGTRHDVDGQVHQAAASVVTQRSAACLWQGRMQEAAAHAHEGERIAERVKARYLFSMSRALAAFAQWQLDQAPEALAALAAATHWLEASDSQQFLSLNYGWLADAMTDIGQVDEARRYAARALMRARLGDRLGEAMAYRALARIALRDAALRPAAQYLARAATAAAARGSAHEAAKNRICAAEIALALGERDTAERHIVLARAQLLEMGMDWFLTKADRLMPRPFPDSIASIETS